MLKTIAKSDGVITFDGVSFVEIPVSEVLALAGGEASGKSIKVIDARKVVTLADTTANHDGLPVQLTVSLRIERTPITEAEAQAIARTAAKQTASKAEREAKQLAGENRLIEAVTATAINVAKATQKSDSVTEQINRAVSARIGSAFGVPALTDGK